jgi:hypothetical protein
MKTQIEVGTTLNRAQLKNIVGGDDYLENSDVACGSAGDYCGSAWYNPCCSGLTCYQVDGEPLKCRKL